MKTLVTHNSIGQCHHGYSNLILQTKLMSNDDDVS